MKLACIKKTKSILSKVSITVEILIVCVMFFSGCATKTLWYRSGDPQPKYKISGEITQILFTTPYDKVYFRYQFQDNKTKEFKRTPFSKYESGFFSIGYDDTGLEKILNPPYANEILKIYAIDQHHASDLNSWSITFPETYMGVKNYPMGDDFRIIISLKSTVEIDNNINFEKDIPKELRKFSLEKQFEKPTIFFIYRGSTRYYSNFVNSLDLLTDESIIDTKDIHFTFDYYVMNASYENPLTLRIIGTPFTIIFDIITFPFQYILDKIFIGIH
jgi:hypothetical protein